MSSWQSLLQVVGGFEIGEEIGGPVESAVAEPEFGEIGMAARLDQLADLDLVGSRGGGGKGERHIAKAEFDQSIAEPPLAIKVSLRGRPAQRSEERGVGR